MWSDTESLGEAPRPVIIEGAHCTTQPALEPDAMYIDCLFSDFAWKDSVVERMRFVNCRFERLDVSQLQFEQVMWQNCQFLDLTWRDSSLVRCVFNECVLQDLSFTRCEMRHVTFSQTKANRLHMLSSHCEHLTFADCESSETKFSSVHFSDASWVGATILDWTLDDCELQRFIVAKISCERASFTRCIGINVRWIHCVLRSLELRACEWEQAAWSHSQWQGGSLRQSILKLPCFDAAQLRNIDWTRVRMTGAVFDGAHVEDCDMRQLDAPGLSLRNASLSRVNLDAAKLRGLDGRDALLQSVSLLDADCRDAFLIGQERSVWQAAHLNGARFTTPKELDDTAWRNKVRPGFRIALP